MTTGFRGVSLSSDRVIAGVIRVVVGVILLYAAIVKASDLSMFIVVIREIVPDAIVISSSRGVVIGSAVILVESVVGLILVLQLLPSRSHWIGIGLFTIFTLLLIYLFSLEEPISCGCLGFTPKGLSTRGELGLGIARNIIIILSLIFVGRLSKGSVSGVPAEA